MNFMKFLNFHKKPHFLPQSALWAIWAPKTINICCAMGGFPPRAGNVRFFAKSCTFCAFHTFRENHFFHDFHDFHEKQEFSNYAG